MTIRDDLYTQLVSGSTTLTGLIGTRVYRSKLPQNVVYPAVSYWKVSGPRLHDLENPTGEATPRVQVSCWGGTAAVAEDVAEAVRGVLDGWSSTSVGHCQLVNETDLYDPDVEVYHIALDFTLFHTE